ncbi:hypothetical protein PRUB_a3557 [Pseudoalteromonas rubra]|uniref:Uncharacterized protein n=1 Tax=Pseudoalteromonas rubra TaxID=43658 RepID=A0A8T0C357_9GAMM|nr:hypothetical protein PRUB_a3554 [Pseudoalteromonas rubra]KAF7783716.1 hypothetical protein PRUB_a3557 [Pseudoalteromonas rubra]
MYFHGVILLLNKAGYSFFLIVHFFKIVFFVLILFDRFLSFVFY